jgi:uncharacterized membrane protein YidH (DUF202 family)
MKSMKILGYILLAVGLVLLYFGYNASQSLESQVSTAFSGSMSDEAMLFYIAGAVSVGVGVFLGFVRR